MANVLEMVKKVKCANVRHNSRGRHFSNKLQLSWMLRTLSLFTLVNIFFDPFKFFPTIT